MSFNSLAVHGAIEAREPLAARGFDLDHVESARFVRIVSDSLTISRHYQLFRWLCGELQQFLPHRILISAWGDFASGAIRLDLVSSMPGVRTAALADCSIDDIVREAYAQWLGAGRRPLTLSTAAIAAPRTGCDCRIHGAIREMRSLVVHGVRDQRGGGESLYIALHSGPLNAGREAPRFHALVDSLVAQIDLAYRRVAALPLEPKPEPRGFELSGRECEILDLVCHGRTNIDIARDLEISPYTVKNHVQRIFRKIGAKNRTQAAAKYNRLRLEQRATAEPA